jgi:hypothetical protein
MRIVIETDDGQTPALQPQPQSQAQLGGETEAAPAAPPPEIAASAAALGAASAGPAPPEMAAEEPAPFVADPGTPETAPEDVRAAAGTSAGAAPAFALGPVEEVVAVTEADAGEDEG